MFLIILVGTTIEVLTESTRVAVRERLWRQRLKDHTIVCGFGTKGRAAIGTLLAAGTEAGQILVIDIDRDAIEEATRGGFAAIHGSASRATVLEEAEVERASAVIVASDRDDSAVLVTLTARELNPAATIVASAREAENVHLLRQSGADSVILSSGAAGQLLGQAVNSPQVVAVLEDLLAVGEGLDIIEREVSAGEVGPCAARAQQRRPRDRGDPRRGDHPLRRRAAREPAGRRPPDLPLLASGGLGPDQLVPELVAAVGQRRLVGEAPGPVGKGERGARGAATQASTTATSASTTLGSNCVPALARSSATATPTVSALR